MKAKDTNKAKENNMANKDRKRMSDHIREILDAFDSGKTIEIFQLGSTNGNLWNEITDYFPYVTSFDTMRVKQESRDYWLAEDFHRPLAMFDSEDEAKKYVNGGKVTHVIEVLQ